MAARKPLALVGGLAVTITSPDTIDESVFPAVRAFPEQSGDPATPSAGTLDVYAKTDHKLYTKDSTGAVVQVGSGSGGIDEQTWWFGI